LSIFQSYAYAPTILSSKQAGSNDPRSVSWNTGTAYFSLWIQPYISILDFLESHEVGIGDYLIYLADFDFQNNITPNSPQETEDEFYNSFNENLIFFV
jgi:hypothetical protein